MGKKIPFLLGFICVAIAFWLQVTSIGFISHFLTRLEDLAYDVQLRTKVATQVHHFQSSVVIVDVDDKSIQKEGRWPWPRSKLAELTTRLQEAGAVVIAFDMFFPAKENNIADTIIASLNQNKVMTPTLEPVLKKIEPLFDNDAIFAAALKQSDTEIGMSFTPRYSETGILSSPALVLKTAKERNLDFITAAGYLGNIPVLQNAVKTTGFVNVFGDEDGIIRVVPLLLRYKDAVYPSLALEAVRLYLLSKINLKMAPYGDNYRLEGVTVADHVIPTNAKAEVIIPFRGPSFTLPYISATDVLNKKFNPEDVQGKIVFIGTSAAGLGDLKATAVDSAYPGVEIQATIADGILSDNFSYKPPWAIGAEVFITIFLGTIFALLFPFLGPRLLTAIIILVPAGLVFANNWLWEETGLIIGIFIPIILTLVLALLNIIYGYLFETRRREQLKEMFGQYVPSKHIDEMLKAKGSSYGMRGEDREMTVLFADIRNFTSISEKLSARELTDLLNAYFTPMTEIIFKYQGTIDKYVGDLIMAFWGAPLKDKRHAQHALSAALEMQAALKKLRAKENASQDWSQFHIGIGLNSGVMSVGDMGSKFRRNYTVLGDAVNLASRVEGLTKMYGAGIIVTEHTARDQKNFIFRRLDRVRVKGKQISTEILEVIGRRGEISTETMQEIEMSNIALNYYFNRDWITARSLFMELCKAHPDVKFYKLYLDRLDVFESDPPPDNWDGVRVLTSK